MIKNSFIFLFLFSIASIHAQTNRVDSLRALYYKQNPEANNNSLGRTRVANEAGQVNIIEEESITKLNNYYLKNPPRPEGYRIQLSSGSREEVQEIKTRFINLHGGTNTYTTYLAPNFRLRVGDFRTKMEAEKFKAQLQYDFSGCYVIKDKIELPRLE